MFELISAREIDEACLVVQRAHLPCEIVRIERNTMAADARSRCELHEPERLRGGCIDHIPHVNVEFVTHDGDFVYEPNVHGAKRVFQQLDQFGGPPCS